MDPSALSQASPYIGAGIVYLSLLGYLLKTLVSDRSDLRSADKAKDAELAEKDAAYARNLEALREQCRKDIDRAIADYVRQEEFLRNRVDRLEIENETLRNQQKGS